MQLIKIKENVECQPLLFSSKSHQDHNGSQSEYLWTLVTFQGGATVSNNQRRYVVWLTAASQFQIARVANFQTSLSFYNFVTMDGNLQ